jgi:Sulfotransferase family
MQDNPPTPKPLRGPDFICIGAQKAGTTWLFSNLKAHPGIWFPPFKEVHYFDQVHLEFKIKLPIRQAKTKLKALRMRPRPQKKNIAYLRRIIRGPLDDRWYSRLYSRGGARKRGDITPSYCIIGEAGINHVKTICPEARIIYLIRDPFDRMVSSMRMSAAMGVTDFEQLLKSELFVSRGDYAAHIPAWERVFGNQIKYVPFGAIRENPLETLQAIEDFIGVTRFDGYSEASEAKNVGKKVEFPEGLLKAVAKMTESQYQFLEAKFGTEFVKATK